MAHAQTPPPAGKPTATFEPYVPAGQFMAEFTPRAILLGALFGLIFGASTVYLGLREDKPASKVVREGAVS